MHVPTEKFTFPQIDALSCRTNALSCRNMHSEKCGFLGGGGAWQETAGNCRRVSGLKNQENACQLSQDFFFWEPDRVLRSLFRGFCVQGPLDRLTTRVFLCHLYMETPEQAFSEPMQVREIPRTKTTMNCTSTWTSGWTSSGGTHYGCGASLVPRNAYKHNSHNKFHIYMFIQTYSGSGLPQCLSQWSISKPIVC